MNRKSDWTTLGGGALVLAALLACAQGGANANQKQPGNQPGGVALGVGDIAVSPVGGYVLFERDDRLAVGWVGTGAIEDLPVEEPTRLAFSEQRNVVYVATEATSELLAVDVSAKQVLWRQPIDDASTSTLKLSGSKSDQHVVAASASRVWTFDAQTGETAGSFTVDRPIVDVEILPDSKRVLVVEQHEWSGDAPSTELTLFDLETKLTATLDVPNCSSDIVVSKQGQHAFLAPTICTQDPISVIELTPGSEKFVRNLPGFGPVALAPDGVTAVGFVDRDNLDLPLFDDPSQAPVDAEERYHLMLLDTTTLKFELASAGDDLPRFAITPNGNVLLVDSSWGFSERTRLFDVASKSFREIEGPAFELNHFALSSDSKHAYVLHGNLLDVNIDGAAASTIELPFQPENLNISADDQLLFLRKSESEICIFDLKQRICGRAFVSVTPG